MTRRPPWWSWLVLAAWLIAAAGFTTWPLARYAGSRIPSNLADPLQNVWIFGWVGHSVTHAPWNVFHANVFAPASIGLAFAENMIGLAAPMTPVLWLTGNPVLMTNVAALVYLALGGLAMAWLVVELGGDLLVGAAAATAITVLPYRVASIGHLHVIGVYLVPAALVFLVRLFRGESPRWSVAGLAGVVALQLWSSLTGGIIIGCAVAATAVVLFAMTRSPRAAFARRVAVAGVAAALLSVPVLVPYAMARHRYPDDRQPESEVRAYSAMPQYYLAPFATPGVLSRATVVRVDNHVKPPSDEQKLFPGVAIALAAGLAVIAVAFAFVRRRRVDSVGLAVGATVIVTGFVLSLGPRYGRTASGVPMPYSLLSAVAGGLTRVPARFGILVTLGCVVIAAAAISGARPAIRRGCALAFIAIALLDARPTRTTMVAVPRITAANRAVAHRQGVVLALPTGDLDGAQLGQGVLVEPRNLYLSSAGHYRPMLNGYASYYPPTYRQAIVALKSLPSDEAFRFLADRHVQTIVVQEDLVAGTMWDYAAHALASWPGVRPIATSPGVVVYDITGATHR